MTEELNLLGQRCAGVDEEICDGQETEDEQPSNTAFDSEVLGEPSRPPQDAHLEGWQLPPNQVLSLKHNLIPLHHLHATPSATTETKQPLPTCN